jgi:cobalt/nickel transport system permease protein
MVSVHMAIGLGEALITVSVITAVIAARPDLVRGCSAAIAGQASGNGPEPANGGSRAGRSRGQARLAVFTGGALALALAVAVLLSPLASSAPDGLESVATEKGFADEASEPTWRLAPLADYAVPGLDGSSITVAAAGSLGVLFLFALAVLGGRLLSQPRGSGATDGHAESAHRLGGHEHTDHRHAGHTHEGHLHLPGQ